MYATKPSSTNKLFGLFLFSCGPGDQTQGFKCAMQVLYLPLSYIPNHQYTFLQNKKIRYNEPKLFGYGKQQYFDHINCVQILYHQYNNI
jgi:hypothetical protein